MPLVRYPPDVDLENDLALCSVALSAVNRDQLHPENAPGGPCYARRRHPALGASLRGVLRVRSPPPDS